MYDIYALMDDANNVKYIGSSNNAKKRLNAHWGSRSAGHYKLPIVQWLRTLEVKPHMVGIVSVPKEVRFMVEQDMINLYRSEHLLNVNRAK